MKAQLILSQVNSQNDNGIVQGNWSGQYWDGTAPLSWSGSLKIMEKYWNKRSPVKYGQCWVFSGVVTTGENIMVLWRTQVILIETLFLSQNEWCFSLMSAYIPDFN